MTDQEKQRIKELRSAGRSYPAIADETGISLGSIKMYFKRSKEIVSTLRCEQCQKLLRQDTSHPALLFRYLPCSVVVYASRKNQGSSIPLQVLRERVLLS